MSLLQSVISDACSGQSTHESPSESPMSNGAQNRELGGTSLASELTTHSEAIASEMNHPAVVTEHKQAEHNSFSSKTATSNVSHEEITTPQVKTVNEIDKVSEHVPYEIENLKINNALPEEIPTQKIDIPQIDEIALPLNAEILQNDEPLSEQVLSQENDFQQSGHSELNNESIVISDLIETPLVSERQDSTEDINHNINRLTPPQPEIKTATASVVSESSADANFFNLQKNDVSPVLNTEPVAPPLHEDSKTLSEKTLTKASHQQQAVLPEKKNLVQIAAERLDTMPVNKTIPDTSRSPQKTSLSNVAAQIKPAAAPAKVLENNFSTGNHARAGAKNIYAAPVDRPKTPEVKIGQVDVFIEAPQRRDVSRASSLCPSPSLSSRHYLRRL